MSYRLLSNVMAVKPWLTNKFFHPACPHRGVDHARVFSLAKSHANEAPFATAFAKLLFKASLADEVDQIALEDVYKLAKSCFTAEFTKIVSEATFARRGREGRRHSRSPRRPCCHDSKLGS